MLQMGEIELLQGKSVLFRQHRNRYDCNDIAQWIYVQQCWVSRRKIAQQFGLSLTAVARYLSVIAAKRPSVGLQQSIMQNSGNVSVRILANPDIWKKGNIAALDVSLNPVPSSSHHARWLALVQLPWSKMAMDDRFQGAFIRCSDEG